MADNKRSSVNSRITRALWMQRIRDWRWAILIIVVMAAAGIIYFADTWEPGPDVEGTAIRLQVIQSETPQPSKLVVRLDDGREVVVSNSNRVLFHKGRRVYLRQSISRIFGFRRYYFVRYLAA